MSRRILSLHVHSAVAIRSRYIDRSYTETDGLPAAEIAFQESEVPSINNRIRWYGNVRTEWRENDKERCPTEAKDQHRNKGL
jgi:hypothetical protein